MKNIEFDEENYEEEYDIPDCCIACGGNYPECIDSCSIFEDDDY